MDKSRLLKSFLFYNILLVFVTVLFLSVYFISRGFGLDLFECTFHRELGIYCPGCGGTRSLVFLLRLDFANCFLSYPPLLPTLFLIVTCDLLVVFSLVFNKPRLSKLFKKEYFLIVPALIVINFLVENCLLFLGISYMPVL